MMNPMNTFGRAQHRILFSTAVVTAVCGRRRILRKGEISQLVLNEQSPI